jgi:hypothetical protein
MNLVDRALDKGVQEVSDYMQDLFDSFNSTQVSNVQTKKRDRDR